MKKIYLIATILILLLAFPSKSYAYWHFAGMKIPTNYSELKETLSGSDEEKGDKKVKIDKKLSKNTAITVDGEKVFEHTLNIDQDSKNPQDVERKTKLQSGESSYKYWVFILTETEINRYLNQSLFGQTYAGYTVEGGNIELEEGLIKLTLNLDRNVEIYAEIYPTEKGDGLIVKKLENRGEKSLSGIQMLTIRQFVKNAKTLAFQAYPEYKNQFSHIEVEDTLIRVWLLNNQ